MTTKPTLGLRIYPNAVKAADADLIRLQSLAATLDARQTVVLDEALQPRPTVVPPRIPDELRQMSQAVLAQLRCTRQWKVDEATAEVFILESKNNANPRWLKIKPIWSEGKFTGVVRDEKGRDVRVELPETSK